MKRIIIILCILLLLIGCSTEQQCSPTEKNCTLQHQNQKQGSSLSSKDYTFHINFIIDETAACPSEVKCDLFSIPKMNLYLKGNMKVASNNQITGEGVMRYIDVSACKTLLTDTSYCEVSGVDDGTFSISGHMEGTKAYVTLSSSNYPQLHATMTTQMPSGSYPIALDNTYSSNIKNLLSNAKVMDSEMILEPISASTPDSEKYYFDGSYTLMGTERTLHGYGGLFFISPTTELPEAYSAS